VLAPLIDWKQALKQAPIEKDLLLSFQWTQVGAIITFIRR